MTFPIPVALVGALTLALPFSLPFSLQFATDLAADDSGDQQTIGSVALAAVETDLVEGDERSNDHHGHDFDHELVVGEDDDFSFRFWVEGNEFGFGVEEGELVFDWPEDGEWHCDESE